MNNEFDFLEIVTILDSVPNEFHDIIGEECTVLGMAKEEQGNWLYSISVPPDDIVWTIAGTHLLRTGRFAERGEFYTGDSIRVEMDTETGEGRAVDENEGESTRRDN